MTDQMIRRFQVSGSFAEGAMIRQNADMRRVVTDMMQVEGFVPLLDVNPTFKTNYVDGLYEFTYTMHGIYVGEEGAWSYSGMSDGKLIPSTKKSKSDPSSTSVE